MTVTTNTGCVSLSVESDLITNYVSALPDPGYTLVLKITTCAGSEYEISDISADPLVVLPADIGATDTIPDGVYSLTLTETDTNITREFACHWVDCFTTCKLEQYILNNPTTNIHIYLMGLSYMNVCSEVDCSAYCDMYNELMRLINDPDCGC